MTAGMVSVPTIVPLKAPGSGRKWEIDTHTAIEISSRTPNTTIFYTTDGSKPEPFKKLGRSSTFKYAKPIYLGVGKITLKAVAVLNDGSKESNVNTKAFQISEAAYDIVEEDVQLSQDEEDENDDTSHIRNTKMGAYIEDKSHYYYNTKDYREEDATFESYHGNRNLGEESRHSSAKRQHMQSRRPQVSLLQNLTKSEEDGLVGTKSQEFTKKEDSAVRKVLNGINLKRLQINEMGENEQVANHDLDQSMFFPRTALPPKSSVTAKYTQEDNDSRRCPYCHAARPFDQNARFCNECAGALPPLPGSRLLAADERIVTTCPFCFADVPPNCTTCIVCDKVLQGKSGDVSSSYIDKVACLQCGTCSPSGSIRCVVCESVLPVRKVFAQNVINRPPQPNRETFLKCSKCGRINSSDARFCDWCGSKPLPSSSIVTCTTCRTNNQPYAKYCASCGHSIVPPVRPDYSSLYPNQKPLLHPKADILYHGDAKWLSVQAPPPRSDKKTYGTQTTGIYFPSSKAIDSQCKDDEGKAKLKRPVSAVSPGKGYWRQQIDHISQHLKIYTQNNIEFRESFSQLKIGKLLGAIAQEELDGQELNVTLSFGLRNKDGHIALSNTAKAVQHSVAFISALKNAKNTKDPNGNSEKKKKKIKKKTKRKVPNKDSKLSPETIKLIKLLTDTSNIEPESLNELIDTGADVNAINSDGISPLKAAVTSKHIECIQSLIDAGADSDLKSGPKGNTPLHEAVRLGMDGVDAVEKLLDAGADPDIANDAGQTPYDIALKSDIDSIISKFTAKLGQDLLSGMNG